MGRRKTPANESRSPSPCTEDEVLATFPDAGDLFAYAVDLGADPSELDRLPDEASRAHWSAAYVAETTNRLEAEGTTVVEWARAVSLARIFAASRVRPIAGASAGLV